MPFVSPTGDVTPIGRTVTGAGVRLDTGFVLPAAGNVVAYVGASSLAESLLDSGQRTLMVTTLNAGCARVRAGKGDIVMVMPDHAENIDAADKMDSLKAGTKIVGMGHGNLRPTFTWTTAAATFLLDVANVSLSNLRLTMASAANGGVTVAAPITVSAAGCSISGCHIDFGADANDIVGQAINTTSDADDFTFAHNQCYGATAAECETFLNLVGCDRVKIVGNYIVGATSAVAVGLIRAETTAHNDGYIFDNIVMNRKAASEEAITLMAGCTGFIDQCYIQVIEDTATTMDNLGNYLIGSNVWMANNVGERGVQQGSQSA